MKPERYTITENHLRLGLVEEVVTRHKIPARAVLLALDNLSKTIAQAFGKESGSYLRREGPGIIAAGIAGVFTLLPGVEIAVRPKFLSLTADDWEKDFAVAVSASLSGRLLARNPVSSDFGLHTNFMRMLAGLFLEEYARNRHQPIRTYRRRTVADMPIRGRVLVERLADFNEDGFVQQVTEFSKENPFNETISSAALVLSSLVADPSLRYPLLEVSAHLSSTTGRLRRRTIAHAALPSRKEAWRDLYALSCEIVNGLSPLFIRGRGTSPGFVFRTWPVWQTLCERAMLSDSWEATGQTTAVLGTRGATPVRVTPDITVKLRDGSTVLLDAKYKRRDDPDKNSVSAADLYESLAFARATDARAVLLLYPLTDDAKNLEPGVAVGGDSIVVGDVRIMALKVSTNRLGDSDGLALFQRNLHREFEAALQQI